MAVAVALSTTGCVDAFRGANVQMDLSPVTPVQAHATGTPGMGELPANSHFSLYAIKKTDGQDALFEVQRFEIHRVVDTTSPCFIDVGEHVPHPGLHVTQYAAKIAEDTGITDPMNPPPTATEEQKSLLATALLRMQNVAKLDGASGVKVVSSASTGAYPGVAADCTGSANLIPPASCTDDASNQRRLALCQAAWQADPGLFEGTDRVLTSPLNGTTNGMVDGLNPINMAPVGGAQFFVENALDDIDAYAIYTQVDGQPDPGTQLFYGVPAKPTRGVIHVLMANPQNAAITAELAVFPDLSHDDVHF